MGSVSQKYVELFFIQEKTKSSPQDPIYWGVERTIFKHIKKQVSLMHYQHAMKPTALYITLQELTYLVKRGGRGGIRATSTQFGTSVPLRYGTN